MYPSLYRLPATHLQKKMREPDEVNIKNIKEKVKSDPIRNYNMKNELKREQSSNNLTDVQKEINKTYKELYGEEFYKK